MTPSGDPPNQNDTTPSLQRIGVSLGILIVILLTVVAAIFLTLEDLPSETPTPVAQVSPTGAAPTFTATAPQTAVPAATDTPSFTPTSSPTTSAPPALSTSTPTSTPTPLAPTSTNTSLPPTATFTPVVIVAPATPTPLPVAPVSPQRTVCQPPADWVAYVVQLGDTLNSLSTRTDSSVYELQQVNCLQTFTLEIGQTIYLPFIPPTPTVTNTPMPRTPTPTPSRTGTPTPTPRPPEIFSNAPDEGLNTDEVIIAVQGRYFQPDEEGFRVELRTGGRTEPLEVGDLRTSSSFEATVPAGLLPGVYDLWVINPDSQFDVRTSAYESISP